MYIDTSSTGKQNKNKSRTTSTTTTKKWRGEQKNEKRRNDRRGHFVNFRPNGWNIYCIRRSCGVTCRLVVLTLVSFFSMMRGVLWCFDMKKSRKSKSKLTRYGQWGNRNIRHCRMHASSPPSVECDVVESRHPHRSERGCALPIVWSACARVCGRATLRKNGFSRIFDPVWTTAASTYCIRYWFWRGPSSSSGLFFFP